jgi:hypothetical protein
MKKLLIPVILIGAVCLLFRQPEYYGAGEISTEQNTYDLYEKDNYLYIKRDKKYGKIFGEEIIDYKIYNIDSDIDEEILVITKHCICCIRSYFRSFNRKNIYCRYSARNFNGYGLNYSKFNNS